MDVEKSFQNTDPEISDYFQEVFKPVDATLQKVRDLAIEHKIPRIQVAAMDGLHLEILARATGAKRAVEIGTLSGYSGTCIARGMGPQGKLYTFESNPINASVAQMSFETVGLAQNVQIILGLALEKLPSIERHAPFDLIFIDADKSNYPAYFEWAAKHLRVGGTLIADNVNGFGEITHSSFETEEREESIKALRKFNRMLAGDPRFRATVLPTGEGLAVGVKISD